jgi:hypothetical protein
MRDKFDQGFLPGKPGSLTLQFRNHLLKKISPVIFLCLWQSIQYPKPPGCKEYGQQSLFVEMKGLNLEVIASWKEGNIASD